MKFLEISDSVEFLPQVLVGVDSDLLIVANANLHYRLIAVIFVLSAIIFDQVIAEAAANSTYTAAYSDCPFEFDDFAAS